jgi:uncharacterized protein YjiS (DUF1127 family)
MPAFRGREAISLSLIDQIKNIRFTNQSPQCNIPPLPEESGGGFGWFWAAPQAILARKANDMETAMSANYPVLPVGGSALLRVFASVLAVVTHWLKEFARARRHRREANVLAGLDRQMLADIGITRTDLRDAFSEPFWDDPTALLRERALERRLSRVVRPRRAEAVDSGFTRPRTDRPARQAL